MQSKQIIKRGEEIVSGYNALNKKRENQKKVKNEKKAGKYCSYVN